MLLRDAQEQARVLYVARRDSAGNDVDLLQAHITEIISILKMLQSTNRTTWSKALSQKTRDVGLMLLVALELANEMDIDSLEALESLLYKESP